MQQRPKSWSPAQFPDRLDFQGWIAFNPAVALTKIELYRISVHEIGHMLGLRHNPNAKSLMYDLDLDSSESLDAADLASLAARHKLRAMLSPTPNQVEPLTKVCAKCSPETLKKSETCFMRRRS